MEDIDAIKGLGDQAPTETKPLHYQSPSLFLKIGITYFNIKHNFNIFKLAIRKIT
jgi:hypothetical protein